MQVGEARMQRDKGDCEWICRLDIKISILKMRRFRLKEVKRHVQGERSIKPNVCVQHSCLFYSSILTCYFLPFLNEFHPLRWVQGEKIRNGIVMKNFCGFETMNKPGLASHFFLPPPTHRKIWSETRFIFCLFQ